DDEKDGDIADDHADPVGADQRLHHAADPLAEIERGEGARGPGNDRERFGDEALPDRVTHRSEDDEHDEQVDEGEVQTHAGILPRRGCTSVAPRRAISSVTSRTGVSAMPASATLVPVGTTAVRKPSLAASFRRSSAWGAGRTSPERLISPKNTVSRGSAWP